jgi:hypothetical protein
MPSLDGAGVWRVRGPIPPVLAETDEDEPVDAELLDALDKLGYAE